jgi:hypothetical protein
MDSNHIFVKPLRTHLLGGSGCNPLRFRGLGFGRGPAILLKCLGLIIGLLCFTTNWSLGQTTSTYTDDFSTGNYAGGSGWTGSWVDQESSLTLPTDGNVRVESGAVRLYQAITGAGGLYRDFVVTQSSITTRTLTFSYRGNSGNDSGVDLLVVELSTNGGSTYTQLASLHRTSTSYVTSSTYTLSGITGPGTYRLRFRMLSGTQTSEDYYFDNVTVTVTGTVPVAATLDYGDYSSFPAITQTANSAIRIGTAATDAEATSPANATATGDDNSGDDEDLTIPAFTVGTGTDLSIPVTITPASLSGSTSSLNVFVDWNGDGDVGDTNETQTAQTVTGSGTRTFTLTPPTGTAAGTKYMRIRFTEGSTAPGFSGTSTLKGEVEDYAITVNPAPTLDYGDYSGFASASQSASTHIQIGTTATDFEASTWANSTAQGDDNDSFDDEDLMMPTFIVGTTTNLPIPVTITPASLSGSTSRLNVFVDWNGDGDVADTGETQTVQSVTSSGTRTFALKPPFGTTEGNKFLRIRFTEGTTAPTFTGNSTLKGEVEDYLVNVELGPQGSEGQGGVETLPTGTYIIPMDNTLQGNFNLKSYGLAVRLLHANVPLKWIINPGKVKDGVDFSANASRIKPTAGAASIFSFRGGPLAVYPGYESQALAVINAYGNNVAVYQLNAPTSVNVDSTLVHKPKVAVFDQGGNASIQVAVLQEAGLTMFTHYDILDNATEIGTGSCFTVATEPHVGHVEGAAALMNFLLSGGNFFGQCEAIESYTGQGLLSGFQEKGDLGGTMTFDNFQEPMAQFEGGLTDEGGSVVSFKMTSDPGLRIAYSSNDGARYKAYVGRVAGAPAKGGWVHYLAGHKYDKTDIASINGRRMLLNAVLRPSGRPGACNLTIPFDYGDYSGFASASNTPHADVKIGTAATDSEASNLANATATGDNTTGTNDEDLTVPSFTLGSTTTFGIPVVVNSASLSGGAAQVNVFVDWNGDGDVSDTGETQVSQSVTTSGTRNFVITPPIGTTPGAKFLRIRIVEGDTAPNFSGESALKGEVEDYTFTLNAAPANDYGDYNGFPTATQITNSAIRIGTMATDAEATDPSNAAATGDDSNGDDEDLTIPDMMLGTANVISIPVTINAASLSGTTSRLGMYIDWNGDGDVGDAGETQTVQSVTSSGTRTFSITPPAGTALGTKYLRLRFTEGSTSPTFSGLSTLKGEVEDYSFRLCPLMAVCPAVTYLPTATQGAVYSLPITVVGGTGPYTYSVTSGSLPTGLTLNTNSGLLSGTPTAVQTSNFTITGRDSTNCAAARNYIMQVVAAGSIIQVTGGSSVGNVPITAASYVVNGVTNTQSAEISGTNVAVQTTAAINLNSLTVNDNGTLKTLNVANLNGGTIANVTLAASEGAFGVHLNGTATSIATSGMPNFTSSAAAISTNVNLNHYIYDDRGEGEPDATGEYDIRFNYAFTAEDYIVIQERFGNSHVQLQPLDATGNVIPGSRTVQVRGTHDWNTGYASSYNSTQPYFLTVIRQTIFGTPSAVYGFRLSISGADCKFFGISDNPFTDNPTSAGLIGDKVWHDVNRNGIQDAGESGIGGATVRLLNATTLAVEALTTTDASGIYGFTAVAPGDYRIEFVAPSGYVFGTKDVGSNEAADSDADPVSGRTDVFTMLPCDSMSHLDAGLYATTDYGDHVFGSFAASSASQIANADLRIGTNLTDAEAIDPSDSAANKDNNSNTNDEDLTMPAFRLGAATRLSIPVTLTAASLSGSTSRLGVFVDWNGDGDVSDASETQAALTVSASGSYNIDLTPPAGTALGTKFLRLRIAEGTGAPAFAGVSNLKGEVEDYTFEVAASPSIFPSNLTLAKQGAVYSQFAPFTAVNMSGAITWSSSGLPAGLSINSGTARLLGTPTTPGVYTISVTAADSQSLSFTRNYTLHVEDSDPNLLNNGDFDIGQTWSATRLKLQSLVNNSMDVVSVGTPLTGFGPAMSNNLLPNNSVFWLQTGTGKTLSGNKYVMIRGDDNCVQITDSGLTGSTSQIAPGSTYEFSIYAANTETTVSQIDFEMFNTNNSVLMSQLFSLPVSSVSWSELSTDSTELPWTKLTWSFTPPADWNPANVTFYVSPQTPGSNVPGVVLDHWRVRRITENDFGDMSTFPSASSVSSYYLKIGALSDSEASMASDATASGDDLLGTDDEDGITVPANVSLGASGSLTVNVTNNTGSPGYLNVWIDFDGDGNLTDSGEQVLVNSSIASGVTNSSQLVGFTVPTSALAAPVGVRARFTSVASPGPDGADGIGEVEDTMLTLTAAVTDFGDYNVFPMASQAVHSAIRIGTQATDSEILNPANGSATGDDNLGDDEDLVMPQFAVGVANTLSIPVTITPASLSGSTSRINVFVDWNNDGDVSDTNETQAVQSVTSSGTRTFTITPPVGTTLGQKFLRIRITEGSTSPAFSGASSLKGEVEDYAISAIAPLVAVGNLVWVDQNDNGRFDTGEGTSGVLVQAKNVSDNAVVGSATTDAAGIYRITGLAPGNYYLHIPASEFAVGKPLNERFSLVGHGADNGRDDNWDENGIDDANAATNGIRSPNLTLTYGGEPTANEIGADGGWDDGVSGRPSDANADLTVDFGFANCNQTNLIANGSFETANPTTLTFPDIFPTGGTAIAKTRTTMSNTDIANWTFDTGSYVQDPTRATDGNRMVYLNGSGCVGQRFAVGTTIPGYTQLSVGQTYTLTFDWAPFDAANPNTPAAGNNTQIYTDFYYTNEAWSASTFVNSFADFQDLATGDFVTNPRPLSTWNALDWRRCRYKITLPSPPAGQNYLTIFLTSGSGAPKILIDNVKLTPSCDTAVGTVGNLIFNDTNGNGIKDAAETGVDKVLVNLYRRPASGSPVFVGSTYTSQGGRYFFSGMEPGNYYVWVDALNFGATTPSWWLGGSIAGPLNNRRSSTGNGNPNVAAGSAVDDDAGEKGIDNSTPASNGIYSPDFALGFGTEPVSSVGGRETGSFNTVDDASDANGDMTIDFGFVPVTTAADYGDYSGFPVATNTANSAIRIGTAVTDSEVISTSNATATGDDTTGTDDEDLTMPTFYVGTTTTLSVPVSITASSLSGSTSRIIAFADWNGDGDISDTSETLAVQSVTGSGTRSFSLTPPAGTTLGTKFLRIRFNEGSSTPAFSGTSTLKGEVEDYAIQVRDICPSFAVVVVNYNNNTISRFSGDDGNHIATWTPSGLSAPNYGYRLSDNTFLVANGGDNTISRFNPFTGAFLGTVVGSSAGLNFPYQMAVGQDGNVFIANQNAGNVRRFNPTTGAMLPVVLSTTSPAGLVLDSDGRLYLTQNTSGGKLLRYSNAGVLEATLSTWPSGENPRGLAWGPDDRLYVNVRNGNSSIGRVDVITFPAGTRSTFVNLPASSNPYTGIKWGPDGNLYVVDYGLSRVYIYSPLGVLVRTLSTSLSGPHAVAFTDCQPSTRDFGDMGAFAPASSTWNASLRLGLECDTEATSRSTTLANGDDIDDIDDEDGVTFPDSITPGSTISVTVRRLNSTLLPAYLNAWIDFNGNGSLNDLGENVIVSDIALAGTNDASKTFNILVPFTATPGVSGARFRFTNTLLPGPTGDSGSGEVEDYAIVVNEVPLVNDFGDYGPFSSASSVVNSGLKLGSLIDIDTGASANATATGDDITGSDDEDGVTVPTTLLSGAGGSLILNVTNTTGSGAFVNAWVDFNRNGSLAEAGEQVATNVPVATGLSGSTMTLNFNVPAFANLGTAGVRVRLTSVASPGTEGSAGNGEVEDYTTEILCGASVLSQFNLISKNTISVNSSTLVTGRAIAKTLSLTSTTMDVGGTAALPDGGTTPGQHSLALQTGLTMNSSTLRTYSGSVYLSPSISYTSSLLQYPTGEGSTVTVSPSDFSAVFAAVNSESAGYAAVPDNSTISVVGSNYTLVAGNTVGTGPAVFSMTNAQFNSASITLNANGQNPSAWIVNVSGTGDATINSATVGTAAQFRDLVFNFHQSTGTIWINSSTMNASVLAPLATVDVNSTTKEGSLAANQIVINSSTIGFPMWTGEYCGAKVGVGNLIYNDANSDGNYDSGEGVNGVTVQLYKKGDVAGVTLPTATTTTAGGGKYLFSGLRPGHYFIHVPAVNFTTGPLAGLYSSTGITGADDGDHGVDSPTPQTSGVSTRAFVLTTGSQPTSARGETGFDSASDDAEDANVNLTIDLGFIVLPTDFGDFSGFGAATQTVNSAIRIGTLATDSELTNPSNNTATGDNASGTNDEDLTMPAFTIGTATTLNVPVTITPASLSGGAARINVFVDWNGDGDVTDFSETQTVQSVVSSGTRTFSLTPPATTAAGMKFLRIRLTEGTTAPTFTGVSGFKGEVEDYAISVNCATISISPASLLGGMAEVPYSAALSATPTAAYSWGVVSGGLPGGLNLNPTTGAISGAPSASGTFNFTVRASTGPVTVPELEFTTYNLDLNPGDTFNLRNYVVVKGSPSTPIDWSAVSFTYTEAGANDPPSPSNWNLTNFNAGLPVTVTASDAAAGGNSGTGQFRIYIVRNGVTSYDDHAEIRVDAGRTSAVRTAMANPIPPAACSGTKAYTLVIAPPLDGGDFAGFDPAQSTVHRSLLLGPTVDVETVSLTNAVGTADDLNGSDDEDALVFPTVTAGQPVTLPVTVSNTSGAPAYLNAWIDYNNNGVLTDPGEQIANQITVPTGVTGSVIPLNFQIPTDAVTAATTLGSRFRLTDISNPGPTGSAGIGEVEDHGVVILAPSTDFGDFSGAPNVSNTATTNLRLGNLVDAEYAATTNALATGDDSTGVDDEDGVTISSMIAGGPATLTLTGTNTSGSQGYLNAWIDYNNNGVFTDVGEQVVTNVVITSGSSNSTRLINVTVPPAAVTNVNLGVRVRFTTDLSPGSTGFGGAGEVEDYVVNIAAPITDFGDFSGFASASANRNVGVRMGERLDTEYAQSVNPTANGDDLTDLDDEDGVSLPSLVAGGPASIPVQVTNATGSPAYLNAWIDFNNNGVLTDAGEKVASDVVISAGTTGASQDLSFTVPPVALTGVNMGARFILTTTMGAGATGAAGVGEVEDYIVNVQAPTTDFGDSSRFASASQGVNPALRMGALLDAEFSATTDPAATGDDITGVDDEDGLNVQPMTAGQTVTFSAVVTNETGAVGYLSAWLDYNNNGIHSEGTERILTNRAIPTGTVNGLVEFTFTVPPSAVTGVPIGLRLRLSAPSGLGSTGANSMAGEIEDHMVTVLAPTTDFGDFSSFGDASSTVSGSIKMGALTDVEFLPTKNIPATGDDLIGQDDEDAVTLPPLTAGGPASIPVNVTNTSGASVYLNAWIDYNNNGLLTDAGEQIALDVVIPPGESAITQPLSITVPANALTGVSLGARFRLTSVSSPGPTGFSGMGEVEDYVLTLLSPTTDFGDWSGAASASNGVSTQLFLGESVDAEFAETTNAIATGDDITGSDDEDGLVVPSVTAGQAINFPVVVTNNTGAPAYLNAWIDYNNDGSLASGGENVVANLLVNSGQTRVTLSPLVLIPSSVVTGVNLGVRLRLTAAASPGPAGNSGTLGEVEDYQILIAAPTTDQGDFSSFEGASSTVSNTIRIGTLVDAEYAASVNSLATGDDLNGIDDEDGVVLPAMRAGDPAVLPVTVMNTSGEVAYLNAWIDYNDDGQLDNGDEQIAANVEVPSGAASSVHDISFTVSPDAVSGRPIGVRVRFSSTSTPFAIGHFGMGEVEDYVVTIAPPPLDYGDWSGLADASSWGDSRLRMGLLVDTEFVSMRNSTALGDDNRGVDDEDGVILPPLTAGAPASIPVIVTNTTDALAYLNAWFDFNNNQETDPGEQIANNVVIEAGLLESEMDLNFTVPAGATVGSSVGLRFRLTNTLSPGVVGNSGIGEVEDYTANIAAPVTDFGDWSGAGLASNVASSDLRMGALVDTEYIANINGSATGDDQVGSDDEDGVSLPSTVTPGTSTNATVVVTNNTTSPGYLSGWVDFNNNGSFDDEGEQIATDILVPSNTQGLAQNISLLVPVDAIPGDRGARFRLTETPGFGPEGEGTVGEVEDYLFNVGCLPFSVGPASLPNPVAGTTYSQVVSANGIHGPYEFSVSSGALPAGLTIHPDTGVISGSHTSSASVTFTIAAQDVHGCTATKVYTLVPVCPTITVGPTTIPGATVGTIYTQAFTQSGASSGNVSYSLGSGTLPNGLTLTSAGILSGNPTVSGTFNFTIRVTDASGCQGNQAYTMVVTVFRDFGDYSGFQSASQIAHTAIRLGTAATDFETVNPANSTGTGDDEVGVDDEDLVMPVFTLGQATTLSIPVTLTAASLANGTSRLRVFVDWNGDNDVADAGETQSAQAVVSTGTRTYNLTPPAGTVAGTKYLRVRISEGSSTPSFLGNSVGKGEVEDYAITVACPTMTMLLAAPSEAVIGQAYSKALTVTGTSGAVVYSLASGALPVGLNLDPNTGVISGIPTTEESAGFTISATDARSCTVSRNFVIPVSCPVIVFDPLTLPVGRVGESYVQGTGFTVTGGTEPYSNWNAVGQAPGLTIDPNTQQLIGTPTAPGWYDVTISTRDFYSCPASQGFLLQVCPTISISPATLGLATVGTAYTQTLTATGGNGAYAWSTVSGTWPEGLSLSSGGVVSGTPTLGNGAGVNVTVRATDVDGCSSDQVVSIKVCPVITLATINEATFVGQSYSQFALASGGVAPYQYEITAGELPAGLSLDADTGEIFGTPTNTIGKTVTITATDAFDCTGSKVYTFVPNCGIPDIGTAHRLPRALSESHTPTPSLSRSPPV